MILVGGLLAVGGALAAGLAGPRHARVRRAGALLLVVGLAMLAAGGVRALS